MVIIYNFFVVKIKGQVFHQRWICLWQTNLSLQLNSLRLCALWFNKRAVPEPPLHIYALCSLRISGFSFPVLFALCAMLSQQHHLLCINKFSRLDPVDIQPGADFYTKVVSTIPGDLMVSGRFFPVYKRFNFLS